MKSEPYQLKRVLNIPIDREDEESIYLTIGNGGNKNLKIEFYTERWRSAKEWTLLLTEIINEINSLKEEGIIQ